jgi:hypothetical protein
MMHGQQNIKISPEYEIMFGAIFFETGGGWESRLK